MAAAERSGPSPHRAGTTPLDGGDPAALPAFAVAVDVVTLTIVDGELHVLLVRRGADPHRGAWSLPGGFKRPDETLDEAAARELHEGVGVESPRQLVQLGAYGDPGRDPRTDVVTVGYLAVIVDRTGVVAGSDADDARLSPVADALGGGLELAFDHEQILSDAVDRVADDLADTDLATAFIGPTFTLSELQSVYEAIWGEPLDAANFRRSLTAQLADPADEAFLEPTGERTPAGPKGGRPAELYRAGAAWAGGSPVRHPPRRRRRRGPAQRTPSPASHVDSTSLPTPAADAAPPGRDRTAEVDPGNTRPKPPTPVVPARSRSRPLPSQQRRRAARYSTTD